jgi:hypothetical protein
MAQTAAHLVDHVIPHVPVRQWVLSLPIPLRVLLAAQTELVTPVPQLPTAPRLFAFGALALANSHLNKDQIQKGTFQLWVDTGPRLS